MRWWNELTPPPPACFPPSASPPPSAAPSPRRTLPGRGDVALIGWDLWQRRFGGSQQVVGERVQLDGRELTLIGVLPPGFRLPDDFAVGGASGDAPAR